MRIVQVAPKGTHHPMLEGQASFHVQKKRYCIENFKCKIACNVAVHVSRALWSISRRDCASSSVRMFA